MRISRIFIGESLAVGSSISLSNTASHYLRNVLRLKAGDEVALFNGEDDFDYYAQLEINGKQANAIVLSRKYLETESSLDTEIIQGLGRADHIDLSIQKCTELGVKNITLFNAEYSQIPLKPNQRDRRLAHWQAIAVKACEQCGRHKPPHIRFFKSLGDAFKASTRECKLLLDFDTPGLPNYLSSAKPDKQVSLLVGPEGGLSKTEISSAKIQGFYRVSLGPRILRTETAAIAGLTIIQSCWGDLTD